MDIKDFLASTRATSPAPTRTVKPYRGVDLEQQYYQDVTDNLTPVR